MTLKLSGEEMNNLINENQHLYEDLEWCLANLCFKYNIKPCCALKINRKFVARSFYRHLHSLRKGFSGKAAVF
jgi:hypothetical protein